MANTHNPEGFDDEFDDEFSDEYDDELDSELLKAFANELDDADLEDDLDDDVDEELDPEAKMLLEQFDGEGYRVVALSELPGLDEIAEEAKIAPPTLSLEEVLYSLVRDVDEVPVSELPVFSDLTHHGQDLVRRVWLQIAVERRRMVVAALLELAEQWLGLDLGMFLRVALDDTDPEVRRLAVDGLWDQPGIDLLGHFVYMLENDPDADVRATAAGALGAFVLQGELEELDSALAMRAEQALMTVLTSNREPVVVQCRALESIAFSGELGVRQLIEEAYYSPEEAKRLSALIAMGRSADVRWRRLAQAELTNPDPAMRAQAAYACGELEAKAALPDLLTLLLDRDQEVRLAAMFALGHIGGRRAREALLAIADGPDELEALAATEALEEMDFYTAAAAAAATLFDEIDVDEEEWDGASFRTNDEDDDDLGEYA